VSGNIINSKGNSVGKIVGSAIFDLQGHKLYALRGVNIYKLSGELVGHLSDAHSAGARLNRLADKLFHKVVTRQSHIP
jgi:proteasome assembly chaperone (PAC2) family protein